MWFIEAMPGVVDQRIEPAVRLAHAQEQLLDRLLVGDVELVVLVAGELPVGRAAADADDLPALRRVALGQVAADALAGAGDQHDLHSGLGEQRGGVVGERADAAERAVPLRHRLLVGERDRTPNGVLDLLLDGHHRGARGRASRPRRPRPGGPCRPRPGPSSPRRR
jgi:hypothetical protein